MVYHTNRPTVGLRKRGEAYMRIVKEHDERKNEIIDMSANLFVTKGYEQCSVNDILSAIGIAKGTFYHYFKSKEEVLDAVVSRVMDTILEKVKAVASDTTLKPEEKLLQVFVSMRTERPEEDGLLEEIHKTKNVLLHQKSLAATMTALNPVLKQVVEEGNAEGVFHCEYPEQYMQIFIASAVTLLDEGIFHVEPDCVPGLFEALLSLLEQMVGMEKYSIRKLALKYWEF